MSARVLDAAPSLSTVSLNRSVSSSETRTPRSRFIRVGVTSNPKGLPVDDIDAGCVDQLKLLEDRLDELGRRFISAGLKRSRLICYEGKEPRAVQQFQGGLDETLHVAQTGVDRPSPSLSAGWAFSCKD